MFYHTTSKIHMNVCLGIAKDVNRVITIYEEEIPCLRQLHRSQPKALSYYRETNKQYAKV